MKKLVTILSIAALLPLAGRAGQVTVNDLWGANGAGGEWNLYNTGVGTGAGSGIMEYLYGVGDFTRLDDSAVIEWTSAGTGDKVGITGVYAAAGQNLNTTALDGSSVTPIKSISDNGETPARFLSGPLTFSPPSDPFLFLDIANGNDASSDPSLSSGGIDRMVAFSVAGYYTDPADQTGYTLFTDPTYVLAFEDGTDGDYNDLVIEVSGVTPPVPKPSVPDGGMTITMLGMGLAGLGMMVRRFRR